MKLVDKKTAEKTLDVIVKYKISKASGAGSTPAQIDQIVQDEYGKLDADGWKKQKNVENVVVQGHPDYSSEITNNARVPFNNMHAEAMKDVGKSSSGKKLSALRSAGFNIP